MVHHFIGATNIRPLDAPPTRSTTSIVVIAASIVLAIGARAFAPVPPAHLLVLDLGLGGGCLAIIAAFVVGNFRVRHASQKRVIVVGTAARAAEIAGEIRARSSEYDVIGVVDDSDGRRRRTGAPWLGPITRLDQIISWARPAWIVMAPSKGSRVPEAPLLRARLRGVCVEYATNFLERVTGKLAIEILRPSTLILCDGFRHVEGVRGDLSLAMTRGLSIVASAFGLLLLAPFLLLIALLVKLDSPGPVFFVQKRVGRNGSEFDLIKFRTMRHVADRPSEWARDNADRITRVGRWLRRFRFDELPQFVNVLRGDMNLVGPRPHPVCNYKMFLENIPYYGLRECARPGITGWAQVQYGYANSLEEETEKMRYDLYYIKHRSLWLDVKILFKTLRVLAIDKRSHSEARPANLTSEACR